MEGKPQNGNGRGCDGRFLNGSTGGPGRPAGPNGRIVELRKVMRDSVSDDDMKAVIRKLVAMALEGDILAIRELFDRVIGKPKQTHEVVSEAWKDQVRYAVIDAEKVS